MATQTTQVQVKKDIGAQVIERVNALCENGFTLPADYSAVNAVKASMLKLQEVKDKDGHPALECCTSVSIQSALFQMVTQGLDVSKKQAYFVVRGDKLCLHPSYFGHILQVKRLFPSWEPIVNVIREGDEFVYEIDPKTGKKFLVKHGQKLENIDNGFVGAYMYLPSKSGDPELYIMTKKQILSAWAKSANKSMSVHKEFDEKMIQKTVINTGCQKVINGSPTTQSVAIDDDDVQDPIQGGKASEPYVEFEEVSEDTANTDIQPTAPTAETETPTAAATNNDDEF